MSLHLNNSREKATRQQTKSHNTSLVLKTILESSNISRASIARQVRLTRPTISTIVGELLKENLIVETGVGSSTGGKPPTLLELNTNGRQIVSVDLSSLEFNGAIVNLRGEILYQARRNPYFPKQRNSLTQVYDLFDELKENISAPLLGMGVGTPGMMDPTDGTVRESVNLNWHNLQIRKLLQERYQTPIYSGNDAHLAALAESTFGKEKETKNLVLLKTGQGVGAGIIFAGQPFFGDRYSAGEIGHVVVEPGGEQCRCGHRGCLETILGTTAILDQAEKMAQSHPNSSLANHRTITGEVTWDALVLSFKEGDPNILNLVDRLGKCLGIAIANLIAAFNIRHIVVSGRISAFGESLLNSARQEAMQRTLPTLVKDTEIAFTNLGSDIVILGASALVLKHELGIV